MFGTLAWCAVTDPGGWIAAVDSLTPEPLVGRPKPPTMRQIYAIGFALARQAGLEWPRTRDEAGVLLRSLRDASLHTRTPPAAGRQGDFRRRDAGEILPWEATIAREGP